MDNNIINKYFVTIHFKSKKLNWLSRNYEISATTAEAAMFAAENKVKKLSHFFSLQGGDCSKLL